MANWNPKYELDLIEIFDRAYSDEDQELQDKIKPLLRNSTIKTTYGQRVIDEIVDRTQKNHIDKNGKSLGVYSKTYKDSLIFEIYKGNEREVNLTLTGEMLSSLRNKPKGSMIIINLDGNNNRAKAQGHITGRYGKKGRSNPRDFLGLPEKLEAKLLKETIKDYIRENKLVETEAGFSNG